MEVACGIRFEQPALDERIDLIDGRADCVG
jgi:hypothetical protein